MALELRHTEKKLLFMLLQLEKNRITIDKVIAQLTAQMEPEDVKLAKQALSELEKVEGGSQ